VNNFDTIVHNTEVVANPTAYSTTDVAKATKAVEGFGASALEVGVTMAGGLGGGVGVAVALENNAAADILNIESAAIKPATILSTFSLPILQDSSKALLSEPWAVDLLQYAGRK
jgi:hypothetical protein